MEYGPIDHWVSSYVMTVGDVSAGAFGMCWLPNRKIKVGLQPDSILPALWELLGVTVELDDSGSNVKEGYRISLSVTSTTQDIPHRLCTGSQHAGFRVHWIGQLPIDLGLRAYLQAGFVAGDILRWSIAFRKMIQEGGRDERRR
jgi:hypothetical protein